jgi:hypothetical protein
MGASLSAQAVCEEADEEVDTEVEQQQQPEREVSETVVRFRGTLRRSCGQ